MKEMVVKEGCELRVGDTIYKEFSKITSYNEILDYNTNEVMGYTFNVWSIDTTNYVPRYYNISEIEPYIYSEGEYEAYKNRELIKKIYK